MNLLNNLMSQLTLLDVAYGPSIFVGEIDPVTKGLVIVILLLFLSFVGYLIWKSLKKDK